MRNKNLSSKINILIERSVILTKEQIKKITGEKYFDEWYEIVEDIINNPEFKKRLYFPHHGNINVFNHCLRVSYDSFKFSYKKRINSNKCAIAGLLHDFYPYIWRKDVDNFFLEEKYYQKINTKTKILEMHGFVHGKEAALNYRKYFPNLDDEIITNSIMYHMFPLTKPPKYKVGWVITYYDKINAVKELMPKEALMQFIRP